MYFPFPLPSFLYLIFPPTTDNHKSNEGKYSPESNQSRKRASSPGVFSWQRELTCKEQVIKTKQASPEKRRGHRTMVAEIREIY